MLDLSPYLEDIERRIDEKQEEAIYQAWKDFAAGKAKPGEPFQAPFRTPSEPSVQWKHVNVNDALADEDVMILSQLERCHVAMSQPSNTLMIMRANYGVGNIASMFGAKPFIMPYELDTLPNVYAIGGGNEGIERLLDAPEPNLYAGYGEHIFSIAERFAQIRRRYPKIAQYVRIDNPDGQGPMDNCELLWGSDIFYALYDDEQLVHALLRRVTDTVRRFVEHWMTIIPNEDGLASYFGRLGRGRIVIRDDSAMNLSPAFFDTFIRPYDAELLEYFGGGIVHFCGTGHHFIDRLASIPHLHTIDMSQPHLNDMNRILHTLPDQGINLFCPNGDYSLEGHVQHRVAVY